MAFMDLPLDAPEKPNKGLEGGACNRRSCQAEPALYYNHGSHSWYCGACKRDIGDDHVNLRGWNLDHRPRCGHDMFETREQMDARENNTVVSSPEPQTYVQYREIPSPDFRVPKDSKSESLKRLLANKRRGRI